jgi:hypothetical protein
MPKTGRNDACPCGSGRKFKRCCERTRPDQRSSRVLIAVVGGLLLAGLAAGVANFTGTSLSGGVRVWDPAHGHYHDANGVHVP